MLDSLMTLWYALLNRMKVALLAGCLPVGMENTFVQKWQLEAEEERDEK